MNQSQLFDDIFIKKKKINHIKTKIKLNFDEDTPVLREDEVMRLFEAKTLDLNLKPNNEQMERFRLVCEAKCNRRKLEFTEMKLSVNFAY